MSLVLDISLIKTTFSGTEKHYFIDYKTSNKFKDDKVYSDSNDTFLLLDGVVLNKKELLQSSSENNWNDYLVESYKKDEKGEVVMTKRNPEMLTSIANSTEGSYIEGNDTQVVLEFVSETLKQMERKEFEAKKFVSYKDRFQPFLIAGFLLLLIEILLFETQTKWIMRLNLFNENKK